MNYIILDLEATCWEGHDKSRNETIEIGAVKINSDKQIVSEFQEFIKPIRFPILSNFCRDLTTITQVQIDEAKHYYEVIEEFKKWIGYPDEDYLLCSWGVYDRRQFESDDELNNLASDWTVKHISLKHQHGKIKKLKRALGMKRALEYEGLELEGSHHRGIDDARNIAKIFIKNFSSWDFNNLSTVK